MRYDSSGLGSGKSRVRLTLLTICATFMISPGVSFAEARDALKPYISEDSSALVLNHVRIIDGTGSAPAEDQRIDIEGGKITRVQNAKLRNAYPAHAKILDLSGKTVIPGLVGMHEHLSVNIDEVENVEAVFKDGVGYDPKKLTASVQGLMGLR